MLLGVPVTGRVSLAAGLFCCCRSSTLSAKLYFGVRLRTTSCCGLYSAAPTEMFRVYSLY